MCRSAGLAKGPKRTGAPTKRAKWVKSDSDEVAEASEEEVISHVGTKPSHPYQVVVQINGKAVSMEIDTGASVSLMSQSLQETLFPAATLAKPTVKLRTYTAEPITVVGQLTVEVKYGQYVGRQRLVVVKGSGPCLLGRDWLREIRLDWASIKVVATHSTQETLQQLSQKYAEVFQSGVGTMRRIRAHLTLKEGARPRFCRPRSVPFAIREPVARELDRLEEAGILHKVEYSEWASPIVPVPKKDGSIRICGDYKVTINPVLEVDQHPLPKPSDLMASLTGGKQFTKLDLTSAYQQMLLDEESSKYVTINTHKGLYEYTLLPFGVASAPAVFQRAMDSILQGIPQVICYLDDILITGRSEAEHVSNLEAVLERLQEYGMRLHLDKCCFFQDSVEFLGHQIDAEGVHTSEKKVKAILDAPKPQNVQELRSFLGLLNYYAKFLPNLSSILHPLHALLRAGQCWKWSQACDRAFKEAKSKLTSAPVLAHYDPHLPIRLAADASPYGVGVVISHTMPDGSERPIAFASRTLTTSERNYAQIDKEALSLVFGIRKFHQYIYGRRFTLITDHKPLTTILGPKQGIPALAAARMQRWALLLAAYTYDICFRPTQSHGNADALSRLPVKAKQTTGNPADPTVFNITQLQVLPISAADLMAATRSDPILSKVLRYLRKGWPEQIPDALLPYWRKRNELTLEEDSILWGIRVVVPKKLRERVLDELHLSHPGVVRMKALARSHIWWPELDRHLEDRVKSCTACQSVKQAPPKAPLHSTLETHTCGLCGSNHGEDAVCDN